MAHLRREELWGLSGDGAQACPVVAGSFYVDEPGTIRGGNLRLHICMATSGSTEGSACVYPRKLVGETQWLKSTGGSSA